MSMRLYFVRHGESVVNVLRIISNRDWKYPLTELGLQQAQGLAERLRGEGITHLYSSPVMRAVQTAEILSAALGVPDRQVEALRENDNGSLEGRSDQAAWQTYERAMEQWYAGAADARIADGETLAELRARFGAFIRELVAEHDGKQSRIVLVGHGGLYRAGLPAVLERIDHSFTWDHLLVNCGMVTAETRGAKLWCTAWDGADLGWRKG